MDALSRLHIAAVVGRSPKEAMKWNIGLWTCNEIPHRKDELVLPHLNATPITLECDSTKHWLVSN